MSAGKTWPELVADALDRRTRVELPKPTTRAERRRWQAADERDAHRAQMDAERRNTPWRADPAYDECTESKYRTHRFGIRRVNTRAHRTGLVCEFCGRAEPDCRRKVNP